MEFECVGVVNNIIFQTDSLQIFNLVTETDNVKVSVDKKSKHALEGEHLSISGEVIHCERYGAQLHVDKVERVAVKGSLIKEFICQGIGIGEATARRLMKVYPDNLIELLENRDIRALCSIERVSQAMAIVIVNNWHKQSGKASLISFVDNVLEGSSPQIRQSVRASALNAFSIYESDTVEKLKDNPYRIWLFSSFKYADVFARALGVTTNDERRLLCAAEEALHVKFREGSTLVKDEDFLSELEKIIGKTLAPIARQKTIEHAEETGRDIDSRRILISPSRANSFALKGVVKMEVYVQNQLQTRLENAIIPINISNQEIAIYKLPNGHGLSKEQCLAVRSVLDNPVCAISGGAGTGKTSVLYAVNEMIKNAGMDVIQVALSGKATQRLIQQTDDNAYTITSLLAKIKEEPKFLDSLVSPVFHIDEASMVDIHTMYKVLKVFEGMPIRLNFIGDWAQLSPIGPGIVFHELIQSDRIATVELTTNFRSTKGIINVANNIKEGITFEGNKEVEIIEYNEDSDLLDVIKSVYLANQTSDIHVVAARKKTVAETNIMLHKSLRKHDNKISAIPEFRHNDLVIYKRNNRQLKLVNGSTGTVVGGQTILKYGKIYEPVDIVIDFKLEGVVGLTLNDIKDTFKGEYHLQHAYAVTCHSAQGSEFDVAIVIVENSKLVDRSWLYTALTRAKKRVILIVKPDAISNALARGFLYKERQHGLTFNHQANQRTPVIGIIKGRAP
jgi:exodeoxyribonuclease V alpha subunit